MRDIVESGVNFGPYAEDNLFYIEKADLYKSLGASIKTPKKVRGVLYRSSPKVR